MSWKYRVRCIGRPSEEEKACGWSGVRSDHVQCECYDIWTLYCRPMTPGPGCPRGIDWPCPRCKGAVAGRPVQHRSSPVSTETLKPYPKISTEETR